MNAYQEQLKQLLIKSTLCTGTYTPTEEVKRGTHAAVLLDGKPVYLSGPADDEESVQHSVKLSKSEMFAIGLKNIGLSGKLTFGTVEGASLEWEQSYSAIVRSECGLFEDGHGRGALVGINLTQNDKLGLLMCINTSISKILDPDCPELDDGHHLAHLAKTQNIKAPLLKHYFRFY